MGIVFGVIGVERPTFDVLDTFPEYDIRHFQQDLVKAEVSYTTRVQHIQMACFSFFPSFSHTLVAVYGLY